MTPDQVRGRRALRFAGYAALFGIPDGAGDVIRPGAFARAIEEGAPPPLWWQHRRPLGTVEHIAEDAKGLRVIARIDSPHSLATAALARRAVSGLSFGYRARGYRLIPQGRLLEDIDLLEVSLVTHPLQYGARVHLVR